METIGERIKKLRLNNDLTLEELGNKIGVARPTINKYENGTITNIPLTKIKSLANALNVTDDYLINGTQQETQEDKFINLLIQKTIDGKIEWINFDDSDNIMIKFENSNYSVTGIKNLLSNYVDIYGLTNLKFASINKLVIFLVAEYYDPLKTNLRNFKLLYGKNSKKIKVIDYGNKYLKELYQVVFENDEYLGKLELSGIITDLENL